ncbi:GEVED domain-containing protein [Chitinophaga caseinilytica]|uniref:GEVED domain-containing protein n=1 Tax=Chitinophaga caseinilytica TaxID=2267521 RepID=UPI003C2BC7A4
MEAYNASGSSSHITGSATTVKNWVLVPSEAANLSIASSAAVPAGMEIFWHDEFNDELLNRNKWSTNYYSTIDFRDTTNLTKMRTNTLPQAAYRMTGTSIKLLVSAAAPAQAYWPNGRKVSSIQTYDWNSNENYLDNKRGGYFEIRVRRSNTTAATNLNAAYWFDSPGPDLKYYEELGNSFNSKTGPITGVRPRGQVFEIDVFEQGDNAATSTITPFTIHGNVAADGTFQGNLGTYNASLSGQTNWHTHGMLWTPTSLKYYIDGVLKKEWSSKTDIKSPNHFMNTFLGIYGAGDSASMEVDYIRGYQWPVTGGNELPNSGAEYGSALLPWEGTATVSTTAKRSGNNGFSLAAGQTLSQYIYLDNNTNYQLGYWAAGSGQLDVKVENIAPVNGSTQNTFQQAGAVSATFAAATLDFKTGTEYADHVKTVRITFTNTGSSTIKLDDVSCIKGGTGGAPAYCTAAGGTNATDRYITSLSSTGATHNITFSNSAYPAGGYGFYTADSITSAPGGSFTLNMTNSTNTKWARVNVYADWNGNGSFSDAGELLFSVGNARQDNSATVLNVSRTVNVPATAVPGATRLRVRFYDAWNTDPGPCGQADFTTTHDFKLRLQASGGGGLANARLMEAEEAKVNTRMQVYPNPASGQFYVQYQSKTAAAGQLRIASLSGQTVRSKSVRTESGNNRFEMSTDGVPGGVYLVVMDLHGIKTTQKLVIQ